MGHCKDVSVRKSAGAITKAFGHVNEWDLAYVEKYRTRNCTYVGRVDSSLCAVLLQQPGKPMSPIFGQWLRWQEGESTQLEFKWILEAVAHADKCDTPKWFFEGTETSPQRLTKATNFPGARSARMTCPGLPGLAAIALRNHLLADAFEVECLIPNEPVVWVPRGNLEDDNMVLAENFLKYVCSGMGSLAAPAYYQVKELTVEHFQMQPWGFYQNAGSMPHIMISDFGKVKGLLAKLLAIVDRLKSNPLEMLGISKFAMEDWLQGKDRTRLKECVPWWFVSQENYQVPNIEDCFITARRVDTVLDVAKFFVPANQLGFKAQSEKELRRMMHRAEVPPQLPPAGVTEVKPVVAADLTLGNGLVSNRPS